MNRIAIIVVLIGMVVVTALIFASLSSGPIGGTNSLSLDQANASLIVLYHEYDYAFNPAYTLVSDGEREPTLCVTDQSICIEGALRRELILERNGTGVRMGYLFADDRSIDAFVASIDAIDDENVHVTDGPSLITTRQPPQLIDVFRWIRILEHEETEHVVFMRHAQIEPVLFYVFEKAPYMIDRQLRTFGADIASHQSIIEEYGLRLE
jgi:hypothetical protein